MTESALPVFTGLVDLAAGELGGRAVATSDDFFAGMENLVKPGRGVFIEGKYTERGKWMDGWESRRKRQAGHDWCVLELGVPGTISAFDIDTNHFLGNHPPFASVDGAHAEPGCPPDALERLAWTELLPQSPLRPGSQNLFVAEGSPLVTHVRLNIYPDGGVARFRCYGRVSPRWERSAGASGEERVPEGYVDLAALENGALSLACSDAFFGPMNNLLLPGRAANMGGGWETRRKRAPGNDWIIVRLGARGAVRLVEVDTAHFKGNYPDRCAIDGIDAPGARITELMGSADWSPLLPEVKLSPDTRHFFDDELVQFDPVTHLRLRIFPDGGVSRLRAWGQRSA